MTAQPAMSSPQERPAPPADYEVEQALLSMILHRNAHYDTAIEAGLEASHFADDLHARIFEASARLIDGGKTASAVTLNSIFGMQEIDENRTVRDYLVSLQGADVIGLPSQARDYAETLIDLWRRREAIYLFDEAAQGLAEPDFETTAASLCEEAAGALMEIHDAPGSGSGVIGFDKAAGDWLETVEAARKGSGIVGVATGLAKLDRHLGGFGPGHLIVIGGCTGMGKTALATTIADNAALAGHRVLFWTMEMSDEEIAARMIAAATGVSTDRQRRGQVSDDEMQELVRAREDRQALKLEIEEPFIRTTGALRARARSLKRRGGLDLIIVDYLQLLHGSGRGRRDENRTQELTAITRELKAIAKDIGVPVVALAQLSREVDRRDDKRPRLSDLRESGSIEQDADLVMLAYREHYYLTRDEPKKREKESQEGFNDRIADWESNLNRTRDIADVIVAKNRHGPTATVTLKFDGPATAFRDDEQGSLV